ncbi:endonuclease [Thermoproteus tenax]|uniref:Predicted endonuclease (RecB family) n=1 Tax=Thermoproteus tenax (strain ATCC 35583 / DSM 2078 / JCM 9277 / NBRC 100435 / Kra 1) TaxID=768679 RepID=G4RPA2_THETK|nr:endonuclease [Thermoproteus tenax]CCC81397.1 Predicted endonuclease (RecB family) [Thermoproteus tenax Kra 1]
MGVKFETFVLDLLPSLGLTPLAHRYKVIKDGVELGEIDVLAEDSQKNLYAVEIKAGKVDVSGIRQAYINAKLVGAKPLIISRGYADESAKRLADELEVAVITLPDYVFLSIDELVNAMSLAFARSLAYLVAALMEMDDRVAEALSECPDYQCFCSKVENCDQVLQRLSRRMPANYETYRNLAIIRKALRDHCRPP